MNKNKLTALILSGLIVLNQSATITLADDLTNTSSNNLNTTTTDNLENADVNNSSNNLETTEVTNSNDYSSENTEAIDTPDNSDNNIDNNSETIIDSNENKVIEAPEDTTSENNDTETPNITNPEDITNEDPANESLETTTEHNDDDLVPLEMWELNHDVIMQVLDKADVPTIYDITYGDLKEVRALELSFSQYPLPKILKEFTNLISLSVQAVAFDSPKDDFFDVICNIPSLIELDICNNELSSLPDSFANLKNLQYLNLSVNNFTEIPEVLYKLPNLNYLDLLGCSINSIPDSINNLSNLISLELGSNNLSSLPSSIGTMESLRYLGLRRNNFSNFPNEILNITKLEDLNLSFNKLITLPNEIANMNGDVTDFSIDISNNQVYSLPNLTTQNIIAYNNFVESFINDAPSAAQLRIKSKTLKINNSEIITQEKLKDLVEVFKFLGVQHNIIEPLDDRLQLDLIINDNVVTPEELAKYKDGVYYAKLKIRGSDANNKYSETSDTLKILVGDVKDDGTSEDIVIPDDATGVIPYEYWENCIGLMRMTSNALDNKSINEITFEDLATIDELYLTNQRLDDLPTLITKYTNLKSLHLSGNNFTSIPKEVYSLTNLTNLSLSANKIESIPKEISSLTNLKELALDRNNISYIDESIKNLINLESLYLSNNTSIQSQLEKLYVFKNLKRLDLAECNLYTLGDIPTGFSDSLILDVYNNQLVSKNNFTSNTYYSGNLIDITNTEYGSARKLVLKDNNITITKENLLNQGFLRDLVAVKSNDSFENKDEFEALNDNHIIEFIVNGKVVSAEELSKYSDGTYTATIKIKGSEIGNKASLTDDTINIEIKGNNTSTLNPPTTNKKPSQLPNTGGTNSLPIIFTGLISILSGFSLKSKNKNKI